MTTIKRSDLEGSVNVEANITPITRQPIQAVDSADWNRVSVTELQSQLGVLRSRYYAASAYPELAEQIRRGIRELEALIDSKHQDIGLL